MAWELTGNSGTTSANFLGTTDAQPLSIRTNNSERVAITASGNVGVGKIPAGNYRLDVAGSINATEIYRNGAPLSGFQWWEFPGGISYASGNVVVGLMSPRSGRYRLDVAGLLNADDVYKGGVPLVGSQWTDIATGSISYGGNVGNLIHRNEPP